MKKISLLAITLFSITIIFTSCGSKSGAKLKAQQEERTVVSQDPEEGPVDIPGGISKGITMFTPDKVEVEPVVYNQHDLIGEGQIPGTYYKAVIYFTAGSTESKLILSEYYFNNPKDYDDSGEISDASKERQTEEKIYLQNARECYQEIVNSSFSDLIIEDQNGRVITVKKKVPVTEKKDGNAIVRQDSVIQLYPY